MELTEEEKAFMERYESKYLHTFKEILRYAKLLEKLTIC